MCGILGIVNDNGRKFSKTDELQLRRLLSTLEQRGPDGKGMFLRDNVGFGHHRLAIRDRDAGQQPWISPTGDCVLVYNGELYNDRELRAELSDRYHFRSQCDTEIVMAAYLQWGRACLSRFRGMFALGLYDFRNRTLWLVRDRFGIKPLFYAQINQQMIFASRVATIVEHPSFSKQPNWNAVSHYLSTTRPTLGNQSMYQELRQLQPAEELILDSDGVNIRRYWDYPRDRSSISYADAVDQLNEQLTESVESRLQSDVPVGMFLSGGVDSSMLAAIVNALEPGSRYATCASTEYDDRSGLDEREEFRHASECATAFGSELESVCIDSSRYLATWQSLIRDFRTPLSTPSDVLIYEMSKTARQHVGVVVGGEGADELLCGYEVAHWSGYDLDAVISARGAHPELLRSIAQQYGKRHFDSEADHYFALNSLVPTAAKLKILNPAIAQAIDNDSVMHRTYQRVYDENLGLSAVEKHAILLHRTNLEALLSRLDATTMHAGLEARVPFTDHLLVEAIFRLPFNYRIDAQPGAKTDRLSSGALAAVGALRPKRMLRTLAKRMLPSGLAHRKKASFPTGIHGWFQRDWQVCVSTYLSQSPFAEFLLAKGFRNELARSPQTAGMWLWPIMNLAIWGDVEFFAVDVTAKSVFTKRSSSRTVAGKL